ncbi:MAG: hypothetical protein V3W19_15590 [Desulfatiglandales bacterium]
MMGRREVRFWTAMFCVCVGFLPVVGCGGKTQEVPEEMIEAPNEFFDLLAEKQYDQAFALTSDRMHRGTTAERFSQLMTVTLRDDMHNYSSANWHHHSRENNLERLKGRLLFDDGTNNDVTVDLVKEGGQWRIASFNIN